MTDLTNFDEEEKPTLSTGLNVLTILTFIGCGIALLSGIWAYVSVEKSYETILKAQDSLDSAPAWAKGFMGPEMLENARKSMVNKLPILLLTLVGAALCVFGAIEMRKLKKQGFTIWLIGELLPIIGSMIFISTSIFKGFGIIAVLFPAIFIILYAVQRKNLLY